ncbi:hypothetical protein G4228_011243 [Cervus hanglu yarkandensis]|nr:hypothetical protein G4228_011243 [Cervus hanglu yarkandensis]
MARGSALRWLCVPAVWAVAALLLCVSRASGVELGLWELQGEPLVTFGYSGGLLKLTPHPGLRTFDKDTEEKSLFPISKKRTI